MDGDNSGCRCSGCRGLATAANGSTLSGCGRCPKPPLISTLEVPYLSESPLPMAAEGVGFCVNPAAVDDHRHIGTGPVTGADGCAWRLGGGVLMVLG